MPGPTQLETSTYEAQANEQHASLLERFSNYGEQALGFVQTSVDQAQNMLKDGRRKATTYSAIGVTAFGGALYVGEGTVVANTGERANAASAHPMTPSNILNGIRAIPIGSSPGTSPISYGSMTPDSLRLRAACKGRKYGFSVWEDSQVRNKLVNCDTKIPNVNMLKSSGANHLKYLPEINKLGSRIRVSYGFKGLSESTLVIKGTPQKVSVKFECPQLGVTNPDGTAVQAANTAKYIRSMSILSEHKKAVVTYC